MDDNRRKEIQSFIQAEIRRVLIEARDSAQLSKEQAAKAIGCSEEVLEIYESGKIRPLEFIRLLKIYGVPEMKAFEMLNEIGFKAHHKKS